VPIHVGDKVMDAVASCATSMDDRVEVGWKVKVEFVAQLEHKVDSFVAREPQSGRQVCLRVNALVLAPA
jgi:hypothetical protein